MSIAVHTALPAHHGFATLQLNTHFCGRSLYALDSCVAGVRSPIVVCGSRQQRDGSSIPTASCTPMARQRA
jgi:hypothetical protein